MNRVHRHLAGWCIVGVLLGGCEGVNLLATGGSESRLNVGLSLNLDLLRFKQKKVKSVVPPPKTEVDDDEAVTERNEDAP